MKKLKTTTATLAAIATFTFATPTPSFAVDKPDLSDVTADLPNGGDPKPIVPMKQITQCSLSVLTEDIDLKQPQPNDKAYHLDQLGDYATGKGVTVAVIDSGVTPNPRLPNLIAGGDYVMGEDGLKDCDHHGTLVSGIIAAQPSDEDSFHGIAPDATILSIRQTSGAYGPENEEDSGKATSSLATLASGIVRAVDKGADVINMSVTSCYDSKAAVDTGDLKAALNYAHQKGVVLVTAAGNVDNDTCITNPSYDPSNPRDKRNWDGASHISMPSYYTPAIISVGGSNAKGDPFLGTMAGPWVDVAAPAEDIVSLDPDGKGKLTNASPKGEKSSEGANKLSGTSFASAYVTGLVALMLERNPDLKPDDVEFILKHTARPGPSNITNIVGAGVVDPVAALTNTGYPQDPDKVGYTAAPERIVPGDPYIWAKGVVGAIGILSVIVLTALATRHLTNNVSKTKKRRHSDVFGS